MASARGRLADAFTGSDPPSSARWSNGLESRPAELAAVYRLRCYWRDSALVGGILHRPRSLPRDEFEDAVLAAEDNGLLTPEESHNLLQLVCVVRGHWQHDGSERLAVFEAAPTVYAIDVARAHRRADTLSRLGTPAIAVVCGERITEEAAAIADELGVWQVVSHLS